MDQVTDLIKYFKGNIIAKSDHITTHWYTLKLMDEYARQAYEQIRKVETTKKLTADDNEFRIDNWSSLSQCEMMAIKYQTIVNHLGNNLQCLASSALIAAPAFFVNLAPEIFIDGKSDNILAYEIEYNVILFKFAITQLRRQPKCANRIVNGTGFFSEEQLAEMRAFESSVPGYTLHADNLGTIIQSTEVKFTQIIREHLQSHHQVCIFSLVKNQWVAK